MRFNKFRVTAKLWCTAEEEEFTTLVYLYKKTEGDEVKYYAYFVIPNYALEDSMLLNSEKLDKHAVAEFYDTPSNYVTEL